MDLKEQLKSLSAQDRKELLKQLQQEGYSLSMTKKGLRIDKY